jgi:hypothetical protein
MMGVSEGSIASLNIPPENKAITTVTVVALMFACIFFFFFYLFL